MQKILRQPKCREKKIVGSVLKGKDISAANFDDALISGLGEKDVGRMQIKEADLLSNTVHSKLVKGEQRNAIKEVDGDIGIYEEIVVVPVKRNVQAAYENAVFRLFIWRDMLVELSREKPIFGFSFGKPFRSITLETLRWGEGDWKRDGWIGAHNSFLNMIYRAGFIGLMGIGVILVILFTMIKKSIQCKSLTGILLCGIIINWFVAANFLLIFELPFTAIPIWTLFGLTYAYVTTLQYPSPQG